MASYDQNVSINLNVNKEGVGSALTSVATEVETVKESLEGLDTDFDDVASSMSNFADIGGENITPELNISELSGEIDEFERLASALETVSEKKDEVSDSNEVLNKKNEETADSARSEAQSFESLMESAESLSDAKDAVSQSNEILDEANERSLRSIAKEEINMEALNETGLDMKDVLDGLFGKQEELGPQTRKTAMGIDEETRSFEDLIEGASDLEDAKHAVTNANQKLENQSGKSTNEIIEEKIEMGELSEEARRLKTSNNELNDSVNSVTRGIRRMKDSTDDMSESLRAAAEVGDLFEDGLGSLSVNLGAFTVALRNFLTQVPLLLTGLGALGSAATGAAASFGTLAVAMGAIVGAGALNEAESIKEEFAGIENLGEAFEVVMRNVFDTFLRAIRPLRELDSATENFKETVEGLAGGVNILSNAIAELTEGSAQLREVANNAGMELFTIQDAFDSVDGAAFRAIVESLMISFTLLGEETVSALSKLGFALADAIERSSRLLAEVEDLGSVMDQFGDTMSQLAEIGFVIGGGLLPIFEALSETVEHVATAINQMDDQTAQNIVTALALFAAMSKVSSTLASVVRVVPSVVSGFRAISVASAAANGPLQEMQIAMGGVVQRIGSFLQSIGLLGGMGELISSINGIDDGFKKIAFSTDAATSRFQYLALNSEITAEELQDLSVQGRLTEEQFDALAEETNQLGDELRDTQLQAMLTDEELEELSDSDLNFDYDADAENKNKIKAKDIAPEIMGGATGGIVTTLLGSVSDETDTVIDDIDGGIITKLLSANAGKKIDATANSIMGLSHRFNSLSSTSARATESFAKLAATEGLLSAVTNALTISNIKATISQKGFVGAVKQSIVSMGAAIAQKSSMIAANIGLISTEISAAGATALLDLALTSLTGGLTKVIAAIIALVTAIGALAVGVFKNFGSIKQSALDMFNAIKTVVGALVSGVLQIFLATWDAIKMIVVPLLRPFKVLASAISGSGDAAEDSSGSLSLLKTSLDTLLSVFTFVIRAVGFLGKIVATLFVVPFEAAAYAIGGVIDVLQFFSSVATDAITSFGPLKGLFSSTAGEADGLLDIITILIKATMDSLGELNQEIEDYINNIISQVNKLIRARNRLRPGSAAIPTIGKVQLTRSELGTSGTADVEAKGDKTINYEENNSTNVEQTIDADPEEKAQLSRVTKDAIEEANSFARRRQGM